jgi:hypothetical protein
MDETVTMTKTMQVPDPSVRATYASKPAVSNTPSNDLVTHTVKLVLELVLRLALHDAHAPGEHGELE